MPTISSSEIPVCKLLSLKLGTRTRTDTSHSKERVYCARTSQGEVLSMSSHHKSSINHVYIPTASPDSSSCCFVKISM